jgi:Mg-chelatase subunit ChlD
MLPLEFSLLSRGGFMPKSHFFLTQYGYGSGLSLLLAVAFMLVSMAAVNGQGIIVPAPCNRCPRPIPVPPDFSMPRALRVKSIHLSTKIKDEVAVTRVEQVFLNETSYTLEGTYFFPLPESVSISEFAMWDGNKRLVGEVRSKEEARRIYDSIVRSRRDPALLEYAGRNLFQASVFPIAPHSEKKIELTYTQSLKYENGTVGFRYPLGTGWRTQEFGNQPIPIHGRRMPPRHQNSILEITAEIEIASRTALRDVYSPSHHIELNRKGEHAATARFEIRNAAAQPDLQLFYSVSDKDLGLALLTHREPGKDGYFMLRVSPKTQLSEREIAAKDIIFVLDTSGSMADNGKLDKAKAAMRQGIGGLSNKDRFNVISFAGEEHLMSSQPINADEAGKRQALEFVERLRPVGGTNINDALLAGLGQLKNSDRPRMLVLMTDGQPTVGTTNAESIRKHAQQANKAGARLFTFGVGYDVNTALLDGLAADNSAAADYIEPNEDIEVRVGNFFAKINYPVLSDLKISWDGVDADLVYPRQIPDLFHGSQLVLIGRYRPNGSRASLDAPSSSFIPAEFAAVSFLPARFKSAVLVIAATAISGNGSLMSSLLSSDFSFKASALSASAAYTDRAVTRQPRIVLTGRLNSTEHRFVFDDLKFPEVQRDNEFLPQLWAMRRVGHLLEQVRLNGESRELKEEIVALGTRYNIVTPYTSYLVLEPGIVASNPFRINGADQSVTVTAEPEQAERHKSRNLPTNGRMGGGSVIPGGVPGEVAADSNAPAPAARSARIASVAGQEAVQQSRQNSALQNAQNTSKDKDSGYALQNNSANVRTVNGRTFYLREGVWTDSEYSAQSGQKVITLKFAGNEYYNALRDEPALADFFSLGEKVIVVWSGRVYKVE